LPNPKKVLKKPMLEIVTLHHLKARLCPETRICPPLSNRWSIWLQTGILILSVLVSLSASAQTNSATPANPAPITNQTFEVLKTGNPPASPTGTSAQSPPVNSFLQLRQRQFPSPAPTSGENPGAMANTTPAGIGSNPGEKVLSIEERTEKIRTACINGRRYVCGKVLQIVPEGIVVDSGYSVLLNPPFNQSWVVPGNASVQRDTNAIERNSADAVCVGLVFLMDIPKKPAVKENDYVVLHAYPAGKYTYIPVPNSPQVKKILRCYSAGLDTAVKVKLQAGEN
jgi:hypothetical protein